MKLGFFTMPIHALGKDWRTSLREDREAFILADELGFHEAYVGEHATDQAENITSCCIFIASLIHSTKQIKLGTGTVNMPNSHPAAIAAEIGLFQTAALEHHAPRSVEDQDAFGGGPVQGGDAFLPSKRGASHQAAFCSRTPRTRQIA